MYEESISACKLWRYDDKLLPGEMERRTRKGVERRHPVIDDGLCKEGAGEVLRGE
jgi:hypothetical protein